MPEHAIFEEVCLSCFHLYTVHDGNPFAFTNLLFITQDGLGFAFTWAAIGAWVHGLRTVNTAVFDLLAVLRFPVPSLDQATAMQPDGNKVVPAKTSLLRSANWKPVKSDESEEDNIHPMFVSDVLSGNRKS